MYPIVPTEPAQTLLRPNRICAFLLSFLYLVALGVLPANAQSAQNQAATSQVPYAFAYEFRLSFPSNQIDAQLIASVQYQIGKEWKQNSKSYRVTCSPSSNLVIANEQAHFSSTNKTYIKCAWPALSLLADDLSSGHVQLPKTAGFSSPGMAAQLETHGTTGDNPVYYHPDRQFSIYHHDKHEVALAYEYVGGRAANQSSAFLNTGPMTAWAGSDPSAVIRKWSDPAFGSDKWYRFMSHFGPQPLDSSHYWVNGNQLNKTSGAVGTSSTTDAVTVFIGHNPDNGTYYDGVIYRLSDDPHWSRCC